MCPACPAGALVLGRATAQVGCVFNHRQLFGNKQPTDLVETCDFSLEDDRLWKAMDPSAIQALPHVTSQCVRVPTRLPASSPPLPCWCLPVASLLAQSRTGRLMHVSQHVRSVASVHGARVVCVVCAPVPFDRPSAGASHADSVSHCGRPAARATSARGCVQDEHRGVCVCARAGRGRASSKSLLSCVFLPCHAPFACLHVCCADGRRRGTLRPQTGGNAPARPDLLRNGAPPRSVGCFVR